MIYPHKQILIIGGGLAGLIAGIRMARQGVDCVLLEKREYPFHRVCGEYISNEALPFLLREKMYPENLALPSFSKFQLSAVNGKSQITDLDLGGFGISRYTLDHHLYQLGLQEGLTFQTGIAVDNLEFNEQENVFRVRAGADLYSADWVIGAFGKRSALDKQLDRRFLKKRSPYVGVKYHIRYQHSENVIALHNFNGGYCGISNIEDGKTNLCYLVHRDQVKRFGNIRTMEEKVLFQNPLLKEIFLNADFLFDKPETINEISFATKEPVWNHLHMAGDAAGMIAPLCGNGMAMAIHTGKLVSDLLLETLEKKYPRKKAEEAYNKIWNQTFAGRLRTGRFIQHYLFGSEASSQAAVALAIHFKPLTRMIISKTHGKVF
ncbi:MAG: FAD-dependent monooxygenase [Cyclobacteriaceae bacterium]|nr:FAD-dependent monooxygenase [Cyclobacteriaceae bacterium]